jgi:ATP-dependent RNA helicase DeaD
LIHLLQNGEGAAKPAAKTEAYERPERDERPARYDDRGDRGDRNDRGDRGGFRERDDRRPRFDNRRDERPRPSASDRPAFKSAAPRAETKFAAPKSKTSPWKAEGAPSVKAATPPPAEAKAPVAVETKPPAEAGKTFSDAEILASVKTSEPRGESKLFIKPKAAPAAAPKAKVSRATPADQTRLWVSVGSEQGVTPIDFVNSVAGETGLPGKVVGTVDVRERHSFVDVSSEHVNGILAKLNRAEIKGHKVKVKVA